MQITAKIHTNLVNKIYGNDIINSANSTIIYDRSNMKDIDFSYYGGYDTDIILDCIDTVGAIHKYGRDSGGMAVLNFASFKNTGGRFIDGSKAQD